MARSAAAPPPPETRTPPAPDLTSASRPASPPRARPEPAPRASYPASPEAAFHPLLLGQGPKRRNPAWGGFSCQILPSEGPEERFGGVASRMALRGNCQAGPLDSFWP